jgi:phosphate transport system substrate-binding protein
MESAIETYQKIHPEVTVGYEAPGSGAGIKGVIEGKYSLGASSRELTDAEKAQGVQTTAIAIDGVAVIVSGNIAIGNLSIEQAAKIFTGQISNWKDVGGLDAPIIIINRDEASGTRVSFLELCLIPGAGKNAKFASNAIIVNSNGDMVQKTANTPNAVGYCGFGYIDGTRKSGAKEISIKGIAPVDANVYNHSYPFSRELYIVYKGELGNVEKDFVNFLLSKDGQKIVKDQKFLPLP